MFNRFKNHCKNPITWGAYYKLCAVAMLAGTAISIASLIKFYHDINKVEYHDYPSEEDYGEES